MWTVDPNQPLSPTNFHTIQSAIDEFQGTNALFTEINIAPGKYFETIQLEQTSAGQVQQDRDFDLNETIETHTHLNGLTINGDKRPCFPQYQNGYENAANSTKSSLFFLEVDPVPPELSPPLYLGPYPIPVFTYF